MEMIKEFVGRVKAIVAAARTPAAEQERYGRAGSIRTMATSDGRPLQTDANQLANPHLQQFRLLVGIAQDGSFKAAHFNPNKLPVNTLSTRPAPNMGIYTRVYAAEIKAKRNFKSTSRLINSCLGLQIIVAAALTALGAANGSNQAVTVFGAINTVIAGFLTYLKGSGLPNRIKYFQHEWAKVREYIEQRERDLACGEIFDVMAEVQIIRSMYEAVQMDLEANQPDRFVGLSTMRGGRPSQAPGPPLSQMPRGFEKALSDRSSQLNHMHDALDANAQRYKSGVESRVQDVADMEKNIESLGRGWLHDKQAQVNGAKEQVQHGFGDISHGLTGAVASLKNRLEQKVNDITHLESGLEQRGQAALNEKRGQVMNIAQSTIRDVTEVQKNLQTAATGAVADTERAAAQALAEHERVARQAIADHEAAAHQAISARTDAARQALVDNEHAARTAIADTQAAATAAVANQVRSAQVDAHDFVDRTAANIAPHEGPSRS